MMKMIRDILLLAIGLFALMTVSPVLGKSPDLEFPSLRDFDVPQPDKVVLDNGIQIYLLEDHTLPRITVSIVINRCGSYLEPPSKIGLASMTGEVMRTGGTTTMSGDDIDAELEAIGASVETSISSEDGSGYANMLTEYSDKVIGILADVLRNPVFNEDKIELSRTNEKTGISRRNDAPMQVSIREFRKLIYGPESPYARHAEYATIDAISRDDMVNFHKMYVQPNYMQMAVLGDFNKDEILALIRGYFGDWLRGAGEIEKPPDVDYTFRPTVNYAEKTDVNQTNILLGHIGGVMGDEDYPATIVMNSVLGGSFGSRITDNIRSKRGWAYAAMGSYSFGYDRPGFFYVFTGTKSGSTIMAIREIKRIIKTMQTDPPTEEEMRKAKDGWLNSFVFRSDTKREIINRVMTYDYYGLPADYLDQIKSGVEKVTPQDVIEVAQRKLNPDNLQIMIVGKAEDFDEPPSALGEVTTVDLTIPEPVVAEFDATNEELELGMELLAKAALACGGTENCKKIKSIRSEISGSLKAPQGAVPLEITNIEVFPDKSAQIVKSMMGEQVRVFDGTEGWSTAGEQTQLMSADEIVESKKSNSRNMITIFATLDQPKYRVAGRGEADFGGITVAQLDFITDADAQFTMYLDAATNMPIGMQFMGQTPMGPGEIVVSYDDYKEYSGIMMPDKVVREFSGMSMEALVKSRIINGDLDTSIFNKPPGI
jgi:predicted Zn-dependent peptidase